MDRRRRRSSGFGLQRKEKGKSARKGRWKKSVGHDSEGIWVVSRPMTQTSTGVTDLHIYILCVKLETAGRRTQKTEFTQPPRGKLAWVLKAEKRLKPRWFRSLGRSAVNAEKVHWWNQGIDHEATLLWGVLMAAGPFLLNPLSSIDHAVKAELSFQLFHHPLPPYSPFSLFSAFPLFVMTMIALLLALCSSQDFSA